MKHNRNPLYRAVHGAIGAGAVAGLALTAAPVVAQDQDETAELERVQVTGSRIMRTDLEGASPVLRFDREELQATGVNTVADFVRQLTIATSSNFDTFTNSFANATAGVNLRGLGNQATLILVNGRRVAPYGRGQNIREAFVDVNAIPFVAIERIEVLKDGASAIYGSDAIAGVINIILREDFEGAEVQVDYKDTTRRDSAETSASAIFGTVTGDTSITTMFSYLKREALFLRDRSWSRNANRTRFGGVEERSLVGWPGSMIRDGAYTVEGTGCVDTEEGTTGIDDFGAIGQLCRYNYSDFINFHPEYDSFNNSTFLRHNLTDNHSLFGEFTYNRSKAINIAAPAPFTAHDDLSQGLLLEAGLTPAEIIALGGPLAPGFGLYFPGDNPHNPLGEDVGLLHRPIAQGGRTGEITSDTLRVIAGVEGMFGNFWNYEGAVHYARNQVLTENHNSVLRRDLQGLLMGAFTDSEGNQLWYNPFGENSQEVLDRLGFTYTERDRSVDQGVSFQVTGPLFELPGGDFGVAVGGEYREMTLRRGSSVLRNRGNLVGTGQASDSRGDRDITTLFAEVSIPIIDMLEIQAAVRWEDYSDFGDTTNPKIGLRFQPLDDLLFRASWGESFRAPSLFELFAGSVTSFPSFRDPIRCPDGATGENYPTTSSVDCGGGQFRVEQGGNPFLQPETSDAYNIGMVWNPQALEGFVLAVDLWRYDTDDIITSVSPLLLASQNDPNIVIRGPANPADIAAGAPDYSGSIIFLNNTFINANSQETQGVDLDVSYRFDTDFGRFRTGLQATWTDYYKLTQLTLDENDELTTVVTDGVGSTILGTRPEWRLRGTFDWNYGDHGVSLISNYRSKVDSTELDTRTGGDFTVASMTTWDLQYSYQVMPNLGLAVGCINCLDKQPPNWNDAFEGFLQDSDEYRGAQLYGRVTYSF